MEPSRISRLEIKEENLKPGDPISMESLIGMKDGMKARATEGYDQILIWALAGANKDPDIRGNVKQLHKILKYLKSKGIGYKMMFHLILNNCNYAIEMPKQGSGIPFRFIRSRNMQDRALEHEIRQLRKKFQQYAYQLKINHTIEEMSIPVVRRVDKPETIYPAFQPDIGNVYASRPSRSIRIYDKNDNRVKNRRSIIYNNGVILPGRIEDLSPQPSPSGSVPYEVLSTGDQRKVTIASNSMTVTTIENQGDIEKKHQDIDKVIKMKIQILIYKLTNNIH